MSAIILYWKSTYFEAYRFRRVQCFVSLMIVDKADFGSQNAVNQSSCRMCNLIVSVHLAAASHCPWRSKSVKLERGADLQFRLVVLHLAHSQNMGQIVFVFVLYGAHHLVYNQGIISRFVVMVTVGNPSPLYISVKSCNPKLNSKTYI